MYPTLYLLAGYPGSGKTTTAGFLEKLTGAVHISSDALRLELFPQPSYSQAEHNTVYRTLNERAEALLAAGKDVIYDANLNRYAHRQEKYELARRVNARTVLLWLEVPKTLARDRAILRGHRHLVPADESFESMFDRVSDTLEEPRPNEKLIKLDGSHIDMPLVAHALETFHRDNQA